MRAGRLEVKVILDRDPPHYSGASESVSGRVVIKFGEGQRRKELFGPLEVTITFEGRQRTAAHAHDLFPSNRDLRKVIEERSLFQKTQSLFSGPFKLCWGDSKEFTFSTSFPESIDGLEHLLPPTVHCRIPLVLGFVEGSVSYQLRVQVDMPGIDVFIKQQQPQPLQYNPAQLRRDSDHSQHNTIEHSLTILSADLIPEAQTFKGKAKALLNYDVPKYTFNVRCMSIPQDIYVGGTVDFNVQVRTNTERTTCAVMPEIVIDQCKITIVSQTRLQAVNHGRFSDEHHDKKYIPVGGIVLPDASAFTKRDDYTKTLSFGPLPPLPVSFSTDSLSRSYQMKIMMHFMAAKQRLSVCKEFPLTLLAPELGGGVAVGEIEETVVAGPSRAPREDGEQLPTYEEPPEYIPNNL